MFKERNKEELEGELLFIKVAFSYAIQNLMTIARVIDDKGNLEDTYYGQARRVLNSAKRYDMDMGGAKQHADTVDELVHGLFGDKKPWDVIE